MKQLSFYACFVSLLVGALLLGCGPGETVPLIFQAEQTNQSKLAFAATPTFSDDFNPGWQASERGWRVATWKQNGTQMSPERCKPNGQGQMLQTVLAGAPYRGGSMQTAKEYPYGRWVARVKPSAIPGALNSVFTKDWDDLTTAASESDGTGFEVDIEFLTYTFGPGRGKVHFAIHGGNHNVLYEHDLELGFNPSDDFHEWGFDIYPGGVAWHVDGKIIDVWYADEWLGAEVPTGHEFFFNSWTQPKWIKGPPKKKAQYQIDWVRFYPMLSELLNTPTPPAFDVTPKLSRLKMGMSMKESQKIIGLPALLLSVECIRSLSCKTKEYPQGSFYLIYFNQKKGLESVFRAYEKDGEGFLQYILPKEKAGDFLEFPGEK